MQRAPDLKPIATQETAGLGDAAIDALMPDPVIILSAPRAGSTLMFEQICRIPPFWSIGGESHAVFREFPHLRASDAALSSMALDERHADPQTADMFRRLFVLLMRDERGRRYLEYPPQARPGRVTLVEKTPRNALNIPFLLKVFPRARFVFLHRDPRQNVASLIEAWAVGLNKGRFITFRDLPDWPLPGWCFVLPPGWEKMRGRSLAEIAAFQWLACNEAILSGLSGLPAERLTVLSYADFMADPGKTLLGVCKALGIDGAPAGLNIGPMPLSRSTVSQPSPDKWRRFEAEIAPLLPQLTSMQARIDDFAAGLG
ncbi:sulfotransferase [Henriciella mobilis]|uniref:sulfotransferase family protein n=1 Tax=Henriciella mobilis TaxID=2305467 RepID=UPI000E65FA0E|nr:sulfotransferase [Henriciella mobilis]RIJ16837.1 sulfotransferase [Henriciella mobilis]RIJ19382.1 sulfotransferase [Henriciella mobilis]